jgi:hypothetical protein
MDAMFSVLLVLSLGFKNELLENIIASRDDAVNSDVSASCPRRKVSLTPKGTEAGLRGYSKVGKMKRVYMGIDWIKRPETRRT